MRRSLVIVFLLSFHHIQAQNLVPNPGFETITTCSLSGAGILNLECPPWNSPDLASPDLYSTCSSNADWLVPANQFGYQLPHSGQCYAGAIMYSSLVNYREYCQVRLTSPLTANQLYCVSFYVTVSSPVYVACNKIGMYISSAEISGNASLANMNLTPQVVENSIIRDTAGWRLIKGEYLARGGEQYIIIGNFAPFAAIDTAHFPSTVTSSAYYYIDDVDIRLSSGAQCPVVLPPPPVLDSSFKIVIEGGSGQVKITGVNGKAAAYIYNALGQLLYKNTFDNAVTINTGILPKATYFLRVQGIGIRRTKKFLVLK